jgi:hypothetical protein
LYPWYRAPYYPDGTDIGTVRGTRTAGRRGGAFNDSLDRRVEREPRRIVVALAALVRVVGYARFQDVPRDVLPEFTPPTVEVQTEALGLSAVEEGHPFGVRTGQTGGG